MRASVQLRGSGAHRVRVVDMYSSRHRLAVRRRELRRQRQLDQVDKEDDGGEYAIPLPAWPIKQLLSECNAPVLGERRLGKRCEPFRSVSLAPGKGPTYDEEVARNAMADAVAAAREAEQRRRAKKERQLMLEANFKKRFEERRRQSLKRGCESAAKRMKENVAPEYPPSKPAGLYPSPMLTNLRRKCRRWRPDEWCSDRDRGPGKSSVATDDGAVRRKRRMVNSGNGNGDTCKNLLDVRFVNQEGKYKVNNDYYYNYPELMQRQPNVLMSTISPRPSRRKVVGFSGLPPPHHNDWQDVSDPDPDPHRIRRQPSTSLSVDGLHGPGRLQSRIHCHGPVDGRRSHSHSSIAGLLMVPPPPTTTTNRRLLSHAPHSSMVPCDLHGKHPEFDRYRIAGELRASGCARRCEPATSSMPPGHTCRPHSFACPEHGRAQEHQLLPRVTRKNIDDPPGFHDARDLDPDPDQWLWRLRSADSEGMDERGKYGRRVVAACDASGPSGKLRQFENDPEYQRMRERMDMARDKAVEMRMKLVSGPGGESCVLATSAAEVPVQYGLARISADNFKLSHDRMPWIKQEEDLAAWGLHEPKLGGAASPERARNASKRHAAVHNPCAGERPPREMQVFGVIEGGDGATRGQMQMGRHSPSVGEKPVWATCEGREVIITTKASNLESSEEGRETQNEGRENGEAEEVAQAESGSGGAAALDGKQTNEALRLVGGGEEGCVAERRGSAGVKQMPIPIPTGKDDAGDNRLMGGRTDHGEGVEAANLIEIHPGGGQEGNSTKCYRTGDFSGAAVAAESLMPLDRRRQGGEGDDDMGRRQGGEGDDDMGWRQGGEGNADMDRRQGGECDDDVDRRQGGEGDDDVVHRDDMVAMLRSKDEDEGNNTASSLHSHVAASRSRSRPCSRSRSMERTPGGGVCDAHESRRREEFAAAQKRKEDSSKGMTEIWAWENVPSLDEYIARGQGCYYAGDIRKLAMDAERTQAREWGKKYHKRALAKAREEEAFALLLMEWKSSVEEEEELTNARLQHDRDEAERLARELRQKCVEVNRQLTRKRYAEALRFQSRERVKSQQAAQQAALEAAQQAPLCSSSQHFSGGCCCQRGRRECGCSVAARREPVEESVQRGKEPAAAQATGEDGASTTRMASMRQTTIKRWVDNEAQKKLDVAWAKAMFRAGIAFQFLEFDTTQQLHSVYLEVANARPQVKLPSSKHIRTVMLEFIFMRIQKQVEPLTKCWDVTGCTFITDGSNDWRERPVMNFLAAGEQGAVLVATVYMDGKKKTGAALAKLWEKIIREIGLHRINAICTDNAEVNKRATQILEQRTDPAVARIPWVPCAAHCCSLLLRDISKLDWVKGTVKRGHTIVKFIRNHHMTNSFMMSLDSSLMLLRPTEVRFGSVYRMLERIHNRSAVLKDMADATNVGKWKAMRWSSAKLQAKADLVYFTLRRDGWWTELRKVVEIMAVVSPTAEDGQGRDSTVKPCGV
ncbi:hypothetical protein CBR_g23294 [Chara braunii]|uniref:DUF659 domain-containing protein n=1 Tax=Chara braunii TaxID=69332 RepID=A0A388L3T3_CHABU|nr:hypothetical protein CBR_g23294 [Chara braunii]|eukprot:GBG76964.1 hypothetical protein CBR_g23294 [Chara braunii]